MNDDEDDIPPPPPPEAWAGVARMQAIGDLDADPDDAGYALHLSKLTGVPAPVIHADTENFEKNQKAFLASHIIDRNPYLQSYINGEPMASKVSNDDYANLDNLSGSLQRLWANTDSDTRRSIDAFTKEYDADSIDAQGDALFNTMDNYSKSRWWSRFMKYGFGQETARFLVRAERLTDALAAGIATDIGLSWSKAGVTGFEQGGDEGSAIREAYGIAKPAVDLAVGLLGDLPAGSRFLIGQFGPELAASRAAGSILAETRATVEGAAAWSRAGKETPTGLSPVTDEMKAGQAVEDAKNLKETMRDALNVATLERPGGVDLVNNFIKSHGDIDVDIPVEAIREIYGDKVPEAGDNILGDVVEGLAQKMVDAEEHGGDITIPLGDWMTKVPPEVHTAIGDDNLRLRPNGRTVRETKEMAQVPGVPPEMADQVRQIAGADPAFSPGQANKLIMRDADEAPASVAERVQVERIQHQFSFFNDKGEEIGHLIGSITKDGKQFHIEQLAGPDFTDKQVMDILKQLKERFPDIEEIHTPAGPLDLKETGWDVEGYPKGWDAVEGMQSSIRPDWWQRTSQNVEVAIKPTPLWSEVEHQTYEMMDRELSRIFGAQKYVKWSQAAAIRMQGHTVAGVAQFFNERLPLLFWSLEHEGLAPLRTVRHEAIHILRNMGLFTPKEWRILETAAEAGNWIDKHNIRARYTALGLGKREMLEEAICEEFAFWKYGRKVGIDESLHPIFMKIKETLEAIGKGFLDLMKGMGRDPNWQELFTAVDIGEIGAREPKPLEGIYRPPEALAQVPEGPKPEGEPPSPTPEESPRVAGKPFVTKAPGMSKERYEKYVQAIENQWLNERAAAEERLRRKEERRQSREWRDNRREMRKEVAERINERPDVAADAFFGKGILHGAKVTTRPKLRLDAVPEAYREVLKPYLSKLGLHPDDVAGLFGYRTGQQMLDRMAGLMDARAGREPADFIKKMVDSETDRMMELKYGKMEEEVDANVEAMLSKHTTDYLHEETLHYAELAGQQAPIDPTVLSARAKMSVRRMDLKKITYQNFMESAKRASDRVEKAALDGKWDEAFKYAQQREYSIIKAKEAKEFEKATKQFNAQAKVNAKRSRPDAVDQKYLNWVHQIYTRIGKPVRRSVQDIEKELEAQAGGTDLNAFMEEADRDGQELLIPDYLVDKPGKPGWQKPFNQLTGQEFLEIKDAVGTLLQAGRNVKKVLKDDAEQDLAEARAQRNETIKSLGDLNVDAKGRPIQIGGPVRRAMRNALAWHLKIESLINRLERGKHGVMTQVVRELIDSIDRRDLKSRELAARLAKLPDPKNIRDKIDNPLFRRPRTTPEDEMGPELPFTRRNLLGVMLNVGNDENLIKLAGGYELHPQRILDWVHAHATKEDWDFVQGVWDVFGDLKKEGDAMYRRLSGIAPKDVEVRPLSTPHGEYKGGYYPLIKHETWQGVGKQAPQGKLKAMNNEYVKATPPSSWAKSRTGAIYPLSLDLDAMPGRLSQEVHDIYVREAWLDANKLLGDSQMYNLLSNHYGKEFAGLIEPWLRDVGNIAAYDSELQRAAASWIGLTSSNVVNSLIGLNLNTIGKHGFTALGQSMYQVGAKDFWKAALSLANRTESGEREWAFIVNKSVELQRRLRKFNSSVGGVLDDKMGQRGLWAKARDISSHIGTAPVAAFDMLSAVPTALARYKQVLRDFPGDEEKAISEANYAVRQAHGSTAITSKAAIQRQAITSQMLPLYNFFGHIMNRQYEMMWRAKDSLGYLKGGKTAEGLAEFKKVQGLFFWYTMFPAAVEMMFAPPPKEKDHTNWGLRYLESYAVNLSSSWFGARDIVSAFEYGRDPTIGLMGTEMRTMNNVWRDIKKDNPFSREHAGRFIRDGIDAFSQITGVGNAELGKLGQYTYDVWAGNVHPKNLGDWVNAYRYGTPPKGQR